MWYLYQTSTSRLRHIIRKGNRKVKKKQRWCHRSSLPENNNNNNNKTNKQQRWCTYELNDIVIANTIPESFRKEKKMDRKGDVSTKFHSNQEKVREIGWVSRQLGWKNLRRQNYVWKKWITFQINEIATCISLSSIQFTVFWGKIFIALIHWYTDL